MERLKERVAHIGQYAVTLLKWMVLGGVIGLVGGMPVLLRSVPDGRRNGADHLHFRRWLLLLLPFSLSFYFYARP